MTSIAAAPAHTAETVGIPALRVVDLHAGYGIVEALHGVSLSVRRGGVLAVLGPNGAGKTTTVRAISGLVPPTHGQVYVDGVDVTGASPDGLARAGVCIVPEGRGIFPRLSVDEHLRLIAPSSRAHKLIEEKFFTHFPVLRDRRAQLVGTMSGGEQQMVAMARAVALDSTVVIVDELSMGLAPRVVEDLYQHLGALASAGVAVVIIEQFIHDVLGLADEAVVINHGVVVARGLPGDISEQLEGLYLANGPHA
ncbi:ABC transporter ATP-binding protein [Nocardioides houyundeii]|uniref:ABC transporter ATP-binding protein n=1 Tax=Nocardioides houyundeii TaxID=2045452 RepID=UPI000C77E66D|nr:ABC transporter ATP-binding protein [Nocardioides houyundeii]